MFRVFHVSCGLSQENPIMCEHKAGLGRGPDLVLTFCSEHSAEARAMVGKKMKYFASPARESKSRSPLRAKKKTKQQRKRKITKNCV